jgi:hypothetical protein
LDLSAFGGHPREREVPAGFFWPPASPASPSRFVCEERARCQDFFDTLCAPHKRASKAVLRYLSSCFERAILTNQELNHIPDCPLLL